MSARSPMTRPDPVVRPWITPTTPVRPNPVTTSSQPNSRSRSATSALVRWVSRITSYNVCYTKLLRLLAAALFGASPALATDIGLDLNVHLGSRAPAPIIVDEAPLFLVPAALGFQVAVGVPYDMFHIDGRFYLCREKAWYVAAYYGGPWTAVSRDRLPPGLAKRRYAEIIALRDEEYRNNFV